MLAPFPGSYAPDDVQFLMRKVTQDFLSVAEKERRLQAGQHYSEMISREEPPSPAYIAQFDAMLASHGRRLAAEILGLANWLASHGPAPITLVSFARAGTPIGALLLRALRARCKQTDALHVSVSILRGRGLDFSAVRFLLDTLQRPAAGIVWVDGWTAKGGIAQELERSLLNLRNEHGLSLPSTLCVVSDIGGWADVAATGDDYPIPSGILGAVVSGLVSRSVWPAGATRDEPHGCMEFGHLRPWDRSVGFLDAISAYMDEVTPAAIQVDPLERIARRTKCDTFLAELDTRYGARRSDLVKPGIAEATRVLLRRQPERLLLRAPGDPDVGHLEQLAAEAGIPITAAPWMPFQAAALICPLQQRSGPMPGSSRCDFPTP